MEIKIFVVTSKLKNAMDKSLLDIAKTEVIKLFKGLTVIPECLGYWINEKGLTDSDAVETWLIYVEKALTEKLEYETVLKMDVEQQFAKILKAIKTVTQQSSQAFAIDNEINFI